MLKNLLDSYILLSTVYFSLILIAVLLGIDVEVKPFKYSLKNILEKRDEQKWIKRKPITIKCTKCNNDINDYDTYLGIPYYTCDKCSYRFPYDANIDNTLSNLERVLNTLYNDCEFEILIISEDDIEVLYNNRKYMNDDEFLDTVYDIIAKYVDEEQLSYFVVCYDVLGNMSKRKG